MTPILEFVENIMDRVPEASFGCMKTMVLTLVGRKMINNVRLQQIPSKKTNPPPGYNNVKNNDALVQTFDRAMPLEGICESSSILI